MSDHSPPPDLSGASYGGPVDPSWPPPFPDQARTGAAERASAAASRDLVAIVGGLVLIGVVCGIIWSLVVEPAQVIRFDNAVGQDELQLSRIFDADGWYAVIAGVAGFGAGLVFGFWRTRDLLSTVLLLVVGCVIAALVMWRVGVALGPDDPTELLRNAPVGTHADAPLARPALSVFLAWPVSVLAGVLIPLLLRRGD